MTAPAFSPKFGASRYLNEAAPKSDRDKAIRIYQRFIGNYKLAPNIYFKRLVLRDEISRIEKTCWHDSKAKTHLKNLLTSVVRRGNNVELAN
jgi:hypothetical protein